MLNLSVTVTPSFEKLGKAFSNMELANMIKGQLDKIAFGIERAAKPVTPVDTGRLRASIRTYKQGPLMREVRTGTKYAIYVHEGTRFMRGRPFMKWGVERAQSSWGKGAWNVVIDREIAKKLKTL